MFDVKQVQKEAENELAEEKAKEAKTKIKAKLKAIDSAKKIVSNLEQELQVLLADIGS